MDGGAVARDATCNRPATARWLRARRGMRARSALNRPVTAPCTTATPTATPTAPARNRRRPPSAAAAHRHWPPPSATSSRRPPSVSVTGAAIFGGRRRRIAVGSLEVKNEILYSFFKIFRKDYESDTGFL